MSHKSRSTLRELAVAATLVITALSVPVYAQTDKAGTGQVSTPDTAPPTTSSTASGYGYTGLITVHVDQTACATVAVQCPAFAAAGPTNRNPIRLGIQLAPGVAGIPSSSFGIFNPFVPAGGTAVVRRTCASCFQDGGSGMYAMWIEPGGVGNWKSGSYFVQVQLTVGTAVLRPMVQLEIPF